MKSNRKAVPDRTKPPKAGPSGKVSFPRYFEKKYGNGFKIFVVENHQLPIVTMGFVVKSGAAFDGKLPGLSSVTCELLTKGTKKRSATQIAEEIDFIGGSLSNNASWDASQVFVSVLKNHLTVGFEILRDVVLNPVFSEKEIERVKAQRMASIQQLKADPAYLADTKFAGVVFGDHPYGRPLIGSEDSLNKMRRDDFVSFHKDFYAPDNSFMVFAGDITRKEAEKYAAKCFVKWKGRRKRSAVPVPNENKLGGSVIIADKPGAVQSALRVGHLGIARNNPDYLKVFVMNTLLGGYFSSRINMNLREVHGYTYGGRTGFDARVLPGAFEVSADVRNEVTSETIAEIFKELSRIRETLPSRDEMTMVKNYLAGLFPIQLETPQQVAGRVVAVELYGLPKTYYRNYRENIRKVTARDVKSVARKYIKTENMAIVLSGASKEIAGSLKKFGRVEISMPDGQAPTENKNREL
jgi:zinc protease